MRDDYLFKAAEFLQDKKINREAFENLATWMTLNCNAFPSINEMWYHITSQNLIPKVIEPMPEVDCVWCAGNGWLMCMYKGRTGPAHCDCAAGLYCKKHNASLHPWKVLEKHGAIIGVDYFEEKNLT